MKSFFRQWPVLRARLRAGKRLYLFDIDGTLAPIAERPGQARVPLHMKLLLKKLNHAPHSRVGIVSGRSLVDAKRMVEIPGLIYVGNHGVEAQVDRWRYLHPVAKERANAVRLVAAHARTVLADISGSVVESKGFSISLHYRAVEPRRRLRFKELVHRHIAPMVAAERLTFRKGKKLFEIVSVHNWNKGSMIALLQQRLKIPVTLFVGDDLTDESGFAVVRDAGAGVRVGHRRGSNALYYVKGQPDVANVLRTLIELG